MLDYECTGIAKDQLHLPGPDFVDRVLAVSDRSPQVLRNLQTLFDTGRLAGTGYLSILPVDQGIEHSGGGLLRAQPDLLRSGEHRQAGHRGRLQRAWPRPSACWARCRASTPTRSLHRQDQPQRAADLPQQLRPDPVRHRRAGLRPGRGRPSARRSTSARDEVPPPDPGDHRGLRSTPTSWAWPPSCGATCATRRSRRTASTTTPSADLTGQANHLGVTIEADIIKQKQAENNGGYTAIELRQDQPEQVYSELAPATTPST